MPMSEYNASARMHSYDDEGEDQSLGSTRPLWREKYDNNQIYTLDQTFKYVVQIKQTYRSI